MSCFRAHLQHPQAMLLGRAFTSVAVYHSITGLSLAISPSCPSLLSRHLYLRLAYPGRPSHNLVLQTVMVDTALVLPASVSD